jgi:uncharacterized membrane protein YjfL (UPF0719 family)
MDERIAVLGLIQIASALSCGVFILWLTYRIARVYAQKKWGIDSNNTAYNLLLAAMLFSVGYVVSGVVQPILQSFRLLSVGETNTLELAGKFIAIGGAYIAISYAAAVAIMLISMRLYTFMTPLDELAEIKNNNIGVAVIVGVIIIILSLMTKDGVVLFIESMVPYPELPPV